MENKEEIVEQEEMSRPKKYARRELPEIEEINEINSGEETAESEPVQEDENDDNFTFVDVAEASAMIAISIMAIDDTLPGLVPEPVRGVPAPAPGPAPAPALAPPTPDANYGVASASSVKPRRRPRKGVPKRAPLF